MPAITERSNKPPLLNLVRIGHGTLCVTNLAKTRRWYEEVLGLNVIQTSPISLMVNKGTDQVYAVVEVGDSRPEMEIHNHNGFDVESREEVDKAYQQLLAVKDEYEIREIRKPQILHGDYTFYFCDLDGNWWEITHARPGGHVRDFKEPERDLTGRHEFVKERGVRAHMHDDKFREAVNQPRADESNKQ